MALSIQHKGMLMIISGPSGAGKGSLAKMLIDSDPSFHFSCSVTTRAPRAGEIEGVHYHFVNDKEYQRMVDEDLFLEHATVHNHCYGTLQAPVLNMLSQGQNVLLDIDPQGAESVMRRMNDYVSVFIMPPSIQELRVRLHTRNTDDENEIDRRVHNAREEVKKVCLYQYAIINDTLAFTFEQLQAIVSAEKHSTKRYKLTLQE